MIVIDSIKQFEELINSDKTTVLVYSADWCPDCVYLKTFLNDLVNKFDNIQWIYADRDKHIEIAQFYDVMGIPSFLAFRSGERIADFISKNRKTRAEIEEFITKL